MQIQPESHKKSNKRLYFLRKFKSFNISHQILRLFYQSTIQSIILFCISWFKSLTMCNLKKLQRIDKQAGKIITLVLIFRVSKKSHRIMSLTNSMKYCPTQPILSTLSLFKTDLVGYANSPSKQID